MYCPNCGTQVSTEQKFCRACGLELQLIAQLVAQHLAGKPGAPGNPAGSTLRYWLLFAGICVFFSGLVLLTVNKVLDIDRIITLPGVVLLMIGALIALYGVLMPNLHPPKSPPLPAQPAELPAADTTSRLTLAAAAEPVSSVAEHTTHTLQAEASKPNS